MTIDLYSRREFQHTAVKGEAGYLLPPYNNINHISVYRNGVLVPTNEWRLKTVAGVSKVVFYDEQDVDFVAGIPEVGDMISVRRETGAASREVDFSAGSMLKADTLDQDSNQLFFLAQEAIDKANLIGGDYNARYYGASHYVPTDPQPEQGDLWFDQRVNTMKVYQPDGWQDVHASAPNAVRRDATVITTPATVYSGSYTVGGIDVYLNGVKLLISDGTNANDFTADDGETVTLTNPTAVGDTLEFVYTASSPLLGVQTGAAGTDASYSLVTGILTIPRGDTGAAGADGADGADGVDGSDAEVTVSNVEATGALMDSDFTSNGFMKRTGAGTYTVDNSTYLTSFDITTQTDPKYLRSDVADTATGFINFTGGFSATGNAVISGILSCSGLKTTGDVGIGINIPEADLHINNTAGSELRIDTTGGSNVDSVLNFRENGVDRASLYWDGADNDLYLETTTGDIALLPTGKVGIGTDSPATNLHVAGGNSGTNQALFRTSSEGGGGLQIVCSDLSVQNPLWSINTFYGEALAFGDGTNEHMRINSSGNVGIGTTNPNHLLDAEGASNTISSIRVANPDVGLRMSAYTDAHAEIRVETDHSLLFKTNGNNEKMRIDSSGKVGIGTDNPQAKLHVDGGDLKITSDLATTGEGDGIPSILFGEITGGTAHAQISYHGDDETNDDNYIGLGVFDPTQSSADTVAEQKSQNTLAVTRGGKVGIGKTDPSEALDVNGNIAASGNVEIDGTTDFNDSTTYNPSGSGTYDIFATYKANDSSNNIEEAGRIAVLGQTFPPSRLLIGQGACGLTFYDFMGSRTIQPANVTTGSNNDATIDLGGYAQRFKLGRFSSGTTTSSDRNEKRDIEELTEAELRVAVRCKSLLRKYRRLDAYEEKGEAARIHFGIIAQDLDDAFTAEGLDAHRYAMFMEDTWYETEEGGHPYTSLDQIPEDLRSTAVEKTRMGVRYEQLLAFIIAAI